jgi:hypothetical protein
LWFKLTGFDPQWRRWGRHYAAAGMINTGLPFILYASPTCSTGLIVDVGATGALTALTLPMVGGAALVILGTLLVLRHG